MAEDEVTFFKRCGVCDQWKPCTRFTLICKATIADLTRLGQSHDGRVRFCQDCVLALGKSAASAFAKGKTFDVSAVRRAHLLRLARREAAIDARDLAREDDEPTGPFQAGIADYAKWSAYMASPAWRDKKRELFAERPRKCERCGAKREIQVHHTSYQRLGDELLEDLVILCEDCHRREHGRSVDAASSRALRSSRQWAYRKGVQLAPQTVTTLHYD